MKDMILTLILCTGVAGLATGELAMGAVPWAFRPPAVPLVTHDPYWSIWSMSDRLTDEWPKHWTGTINAICGLVRIDGKTYRFCGPQPNDVGDVPALEQTDLKITPTRTIATFTGGGIELTVTFTSPLLPKNLDVFSRPVTYLTCSARSLDSTLSPKVEIYVDLCAESAVNDTEQEVVLDRADAGKVNVLRAGTKDQPVLKRRGDRVRIDWGHLLLGVPMQPGRGSRLGEAASLRQQFVHDGRVGGEDMPARPRAVNHGWPVLAAWYEMGKLSATPAERHFLLGYDEDYAIEYMGKPLRPYWRKSLASAQQLMQQADAQYRQIMEDCVVFDDAFTADLIATGGEKYAQLCALAYRESIAAHGLAVAPDGRPFMFAKENSSNGCIATVDVIYPAAPIFLLLSPELMHANLAPVIEYSDSPRWKFDFAPHDLGTYPQANGQVYGGGEKTADNQMPVEETANMLILVDAMEHATGKSSDLSLKHRALLAKWADYLSRKGLDPENQLCTDDFTGHLAHNVNLSAKAIVALGAYAQIQDRMNEKALAKRYRDQAQSMAAQWMKMAADGDHTKLAFDKPGTWSQKYNLVWDRALDLKLFPQSLMEQEVAYYIKKCNTYGTPLDNRAEFTKLDWTLWSACLSGNENDFRAMSDPVYKFANETPDRLPLTDWYWTDSGKEKGFRARPVVGGVFMRMLCDETMWQKWAKPK